MTRQVQRRACAAVPGAEDTPGPTRPTGRVIQTYRLCTTGAGQQGKDRGQALPELTGTVQRGNQNVPREHSRLAGL